MPRHIFGTSLRNAAAGLACVLIAGSSGAAHATTVNRIGWVWASAPSATSPYAPYTNFGYNSSGGMIVITRTGVGSYQVEFGKLFTDTPGGDVQVSAYNSTGYCMSAGWNGTVKGRVVTTYVTCYDANGAAADTAFTLLYQLHSGNIGNAGKGIAYLWADEPTLASYTPSSLYQYNSTGALNSIIRSSVGNYKVTLPGLTRTGGSVQVTAFDGNPAARCKVSKWNSNSNATFVYVLCFNSSGQAADEFFNLAYSVGESFGHTNAATARGVYAFANKPLSTSSYEPSHAYQYNGFGTGFLTAIKNTGGYYTVSIPGVGSFNTSNVLVTGYDSTSNYCNVSGWSTASAGVLCYKQGGSPVDSKFDIAFQTAD